MKRVILPAMLCITFLACWSSTASAANPKWVCPKTSQPPVIDGDLDDEAWTGALWLADFTLPQSEQRPTKSVEARLCFDNEALYIAFTCEEPNPERIKATAVGESQEVWQDDCVEVWIRTTASQLEYDQFIANTLGTRQSLRRRQIAAETRWSSTWRVKTAKAERQWTAEARIPFSDLDITTPRRGDMIELKLGREDHTGKRPALSTWPPRSRYAGAEDYAPVYFVDANLLPNPDMSEQDGGSVRYWGFGDKDKELFTCVKDGGRNVIRMRAPGRYSTAEQSLKLKPNARYRIEAKVKGDAGIYLRARTSPKPGAPTTPYTAWPKPTADYTPVEVPFPTGPMGDALIIIGNTESGGSGTVYITDLRIVQEASFDAFGPPIPLDANAAPTVVTKLLVSDCRALRGFIGTPVDGTTESRGWNAGVWEYNQPGAGAGVGYSYNNNDGLHITLADERGFQAVVIRGGARCKLYRDCDAYDKPGKGVLLAEFPGRTKNSRASFDEPIRTNRVSFFELTDGYLADVSFFRIRKGLDNLPAPERWTITGQTRSHDLNEWLAKRFPADGRIVYRVARDGTNAIIDAQERRTFHLISDPLEEETPLAAVGLDFTVTNAPTPVPFTAAVQDPLNSRSQLFGADFLLSKPGRVRLVLDFPDQIAPKGTPLWLTCRFDAPARISKSTIELYRIPRERAFAEALAYRKLLLKTYFCSLSEPRPWNGWYTPQRVERSLAGSQYGPPLKELVTTLKQCKDLGPGDDTVRQYDEWIWRHIRRRAGQLPPFEPKIPAVVGAPEWAVVLREAWLTAREVARWWIENRMVETGELGGLVGDDSDMYQNYADFPMFEEGGVAALIKDGAVRLAELAERENLESGLNKRTMDPLHAYEEGVNHESLMAWWFYGDPVYLERCTIAARSTEALTVMTPKGHRHFKSQRCGAADLKMDRKTDIDGHAHPLMLHPALEAAWYTCPERIEPNRTPRCLRMLREWADGWLEHFQPGKYATAVEVATEKVTATTNRPLYGGYGALGSAFSFLYWITNDEKYLGPFMDEFAAGRSNTSPRNILPELIHRHGLENLGNKRGENVAQAASLRNDVARAASLRDNVARAASLRNDVARAASLRNDVARAASLRDNVARAASLRNLVRGTGIAETLITGDKRPLIDALKRDVAELQRFPAMYTTSEPFTDRVFLYAITNATIAYTGGYATRNKLCHTHAVSWGGFGTDFAALVLKAKRDRLKVLVYNFAENELSGRMKTWTLDHGMYRLTIGLDADNDDNADGVEREEKVEALRATAIPLQLAPKVVMVVELKQIERLDDERARADLALSPREIKVEGNTVRAVAHNIGSRDVESFAVALVDEKGVVRTRTTLGKLEAPLDLVPHRIEFTLEGLPPHAKGWAVVLDPEARIPEIFEGNNRVVIGDR